MTTGTHELMTVDELQLTCARVGGGGGGGRTFDPQRSYAVRGHPMTTGAHEVTTIDELQQYLVEESPGGGTLTSKGPYEYCTTVRYQSFRVPTQWSV